MKSLRYHFLGYLSAEDKLEDIVEDIVAAGSVWQQLEALRVVHWALLLINLQNETVSWL